jgi:hypothetical protein
MFNGVFVGSLFRFKRAVCCLNELFDDPGDSIKLIVFIVFDFSWIADPLDESVMRQSFSHLFLKLSLIHVLLLRWFIFTFFFFYNLLFFFSFFSNFDCLYGSSFTFDWDRFYLSFFFFFFRGLLRFFNFELNVFSDVCFDQVSPLVYILNSRDKRIIDPITSFLEGFQVLFDVLNWEFEVKV